MAYTPIVIGSLAWGTPVNNAFTSQDARITVLESCGPVASNQGWLSWNFDPANGQSGSVLVAGTVYMLRIEVRVSTTITNLGTAVTSAGSGLTVGQNFAGLYNSAGTRLGVTADQTTPWSSTSYKSMALTVPQAVTPGTYYVALLSNGTTPPTILRNGSQSTGAINANLTAVDYRWSTGPTAQTTLPASITMASRTISGLTFWTAVN